MMARDSHRLQVLAFYKHSQNIDFPCFVASAVMWTQVSCCFIRWVNIWYSLKWNPLRVIWRITNPGMKSPNLAVNLAGHFKRRAPRGRVEKELWSHMRMDQNLCTIGRMNLHKSMLFWCVLFGFHCFWYLNKSHTRLERMMSKTPYDMFIRIR